MQRLLIIFAVTLAYGCSSEVPGIDCDSDTDCAAGATCHGHVCVDTTCDPACGNLHACWNAQCLPAFARPVITAPAVDEVLLGGGRVTVRLDRAVAGTTAPPAELQLIAAAEGKAPVTVRLARVGESLEFAGMLVVGEGAWVLKAILAGLNLESEPVSVTVRSCAGQCGAYEECVAGECHRVFSRLVVVEPGETSLERPVRVRGRIEKAIETSTREPPPEIEVGATSGSRAEAAKLARIAGTDSYEGTSPIYADGRYTLVLRSQEAGVESEPASVLVDSEPPRLTVNVKPPTRLSTFGLVTTEPEPWTGAHRRDEEAEITIIASDRGSGLDPASVRLAVTGAPSGAVEGTAVATDECGAIGSTCFSARIPLHDPRLELKGFHGIFTLRVTAKDFLGREKVETKEIRVTRWKWSKDLMSGPIRVSPAIGGRGDVYLATNSGNAFRVSPAGTSMEVLRTSGPITASPIIHVENGKDTLFVAGQWGGTSSVRCSSGSSGGAVWRVNDAAGASSGTCMYSVGRNIAASIGLTEMAFLTEPASPTVLGLTAGTAPLLFAVPTGEGLSPFAAGLTSDSGEDTGVALMGRKVFFGSNAGAVEGFEISDMGNWTRVAGWPASLGGGTRSTVPVISPSQQVIGGAGGIGIGAVYRVSSDGQNSIVANTGAPTWQVINVLVDGESLLVTTSDGGNVFVVPEAFSASAPEPRFNLGATSSAGPAFGSDKVLYFSTQDATLQARSVSGEILWEAPLNNASYSAPALDCSRDQSGAPIARPGTLYVGDDSGVLFAFVTEGHGLDFSSPWPKRHRDPQNTSDAGRDLSTLVCP